MVFMFQRLIQKKRGKDYLAGAGTVLAREASFTNETGDKERLVIGTGCLVMGQLLVGLEGRLHIGNDSYVGPAARIWALEKTEIGSRVFISHGVNIHDSDSHSLSAQERHERFLEKMKLGRHLVLENVKSGPVVIDDDVWIGFNAIILKGVRVGRGAVVGAGSVITKDVEPYTIVVGNPQRVTGKSLP